MLKIYNTLTKQKEEFHALYERHSVPLSGTPSQGKESDRLVTMYNCGPTVYDFAHIGNMRAFLMADIIRRSLEFLGYKVHQVRNYTDVGHMTMTEVQKELNKEAEVTDAEDGLDRMEKAAKREGKTVWDIAEFYINAVDKDCEEMNFLVPTDRPRATNYIKEQIEMIQELEKRGFTYDTAEAVYFDTAKYEEFVKTNSELKLLDYGILTGQNLAEKKTAVRDEVNEDQNKKNPADFRLWQKIVGNNSEHSMKWESPWGVGFPGWHIECSAMSRSLLGETIDIHTGGVDHIPVHHTNEIAQSEGSSLKPFAKYWIHNEFILVDGKKMSKSLGNFYKLQDLVEKGFEPMDLRYYYLTANFRRSQNITLDELTKTREVRLKLIEKIKRINTENLSPHDSSAPSYEEGIINLSQEAQDLYNEFKSGVEDSFNMPVCLSILIKTVNSKLDSKEKLYLIHEFDKVLGLRFA